MERPLDWSLPCYWNFRLCILSAQKDGIMRMVDEYPMSWLPRYGGRT